MNKPYYPLYTGDFLKETNMLDAEKIGFLILVVMAAWNNNGQGFIECSWTDLKFICHAENPEHVKQNLSKIQAKGILTIDFVSKNDDPELEIVRINYPTMIHQYHVSQVRAAAGSAGGKESSKKKSLKNKRAAKSKQNSDFDTDTDNQKVKGGMEGKKLKTPFSDSFQPHWDNWKAYKLEQYNFKYKSLRSEQPALNELISLADNNEETAIKIMNQSIASGWQGFFPLKDKANGKQRNGSGKNEGANQLVESFRNEFAGLS